MHITMLYPCREIMDDEGMLNSEQNVRLCPFCVMEEEMCGLDDVDLPHPDKETCIFEQDEDSQLELEWDHGEEDEKACSDRMSNAANKSHRFSRVYDVDSIIGKAYVPIEYKPVRGSPSVRVKKNPFILSDAIHSTKRIRMTFEDKAENTFKMAYGTAFAVSPKLACSARHCFCKDGVNLVKIDISEGSHVSLCRFDSASFEGEFAGASTQHWSKTKDQEGLFKEGADVGIFRIQGKFKSFLLPCSPSFLSRSHRNNVAILSYPSVNNVLQKAKEDLSKSSMSSTWRAYKPAMAKDIEDAVQKYAISKKVSLPDTKTKRLVTARVLKQIKQDLFNDLLDTFGGFSSGDLLCAVGSITGWNEVSIGCTCSTLRGSSGAALCAINLAHYFFGIHSGGSCGFDLNGATSTDNPEFVSLYMTEVLPTLPSPNSHYWKGIDMAGFFHWLKLHASEIPNESPWLARILESKRKVHSENGSLCTKHRS